MDDNRRMTNPVHPERQIPQVRARAVHFDSHISMLCPAGHLIATIMLDRKINGTNPFGGSAGEMELSNFQHGRPNRFDRLAKECCEEDTPQPSSH